MGHSKERVAQARARMEAEKVNAQQAGHVPLLMTQPMKPPSGALPVKTVMVVLGGAIGLFLAVATWATSDSGGLFPAGSLRRSTSSSAATPPPGYVSAQTLHPWPLSIPEGVLQCSGGQVTLEAGGQVWAINGTAKGTGRYRDVSEIWPRQENIGPLIQRGLSLC